MQTGQLFWVTNFKIKDEFFLSVDKQSQDPNEIILGSPRLKHVLDSKQKKNVNKM